MIVTKNLDIFIGLKTVIWALTETLGADRSRKRLNYGATMEMADDGAWSCMGWHRSRAYEHSKLEPDLISVTVSAPKLPNFFVSGHVSATAVTRIKVSGYGRMCINRFQLASIVNEEEAAAEFPPHWQTKTRGPSDILVAWNESEYSLPR